MAWESIRDLRRSDAGVRSGITVPRPFPWQLKALRMSQGCNPDTGKFEDIRIGVCVMGRRAGKTTALSRILGQLALENPGKEFYWGAHTVDGAAIGKSAFMGPINGISADGVPHSWTMYGPAVERHLLKPPEAVLKNGSRVMWRALEKGHGSAIGRGNMLAVVDEAARVPERVFWEDLFPTVADTGGRMILITTPRGTKNFVYRMFQRAREGQKHYAWCSGPSTDNPNPQVKEFVKIAQESGMPDELFRQEFMGEFIDGDGSVFRNVRKCAHLGGWRETPKPGAMYVVAADVAKRRDWTVIGAMDVHTGELHGVNRFRGAPWPLVAQRIAEFSRHWGAGDVAPIWMDSTGVGDAPFDDLVSQGLPANGIVFSGAQKEKLITCLRVALEKERISYPADDLLLGELESFEMDVKPSGRFSYAAPPGKHDDHVDMLALATWARNLAVGWGNSSVEYGWA